MKVKRVFIGQFRPNLGSPNGNVMCSCGHTLQTREAYLAHWTLGHFDAPVWKYLFEKDGKVVESLEMPKGGQLDE